MTLAVNIAQGGSNNVTFRNRLINGNMVFDQRNAGASVTASTTGQFVYTLDRWNYYVTVASKFTLQQNAGSVTPPVGFSNYLGITSSSAYSVGSGDLFLLDQKIEGFNTADLAWGTANAKTVTLSFQVYSSLTGTFGGSILNGNQSRSYPFTYTVSTANTWTQVSITVVGETTGTWLTTNGIGIYLFFGIGVGSTYSGTAGSWSSSTYYSATGGTSVVGTNGATFYITGVQLEAGTTASPFEYRQYGTELQLCQRYYQQIGKTPNSTYQGYGVGVAVNSTTVEIIIPFVVTMRTAPSFTFNNPTNSLITGGAGSVSAVSSDISTPFNIMYQCISSGLTTGYGTRHFQNSTSTTSLELSAEL
jgi:hypothetical protein